MPTALLLSLGADSAAIAAAGHRLGRDLDCLTVATEGKDDESRGAEQTARHYGHRFHQTSATLNATDLSQFFGAMQRPSIDGLNTYVVSKAVHDAGFKVALSGLGGDEAVGGYSHFRLLRYLPFLRTLDRLHSPAGDLTASLLASVGYARQDKLQRLLAVGGPRDGWGLSELQRELLPAPLVARLTGIASPQFDERRRAEASQSSLGSFGAMVAAEVENYLQATLLSDADAFAMSSSVELRVPFVDRDGSAASLKLAYERGMRPGKQALGFALDDPYLTRLAAHGKRGFSLPMQRWMTGPLATLLNAAAEPDARVWSIVDRDVAERAGLLPLQPHHRWAETWALAALNAWMDALGDGQAAK